MVVLKLGVSITKSRRIGMIRENFDRIGIGNRGVLSHERFREVKLPFMGTAKILHMEKGLPRLTVPVACLIGGLVPHPFIA